MLTDTKNAIRSRLVQFAITIIMFFIVLVSFIPIVWMFLNSFKSNAEVFRTPLSLPTVWDFSIFSYAWTQYGLGKAFFNSLVITISVVVLNLLFSSLAAFATSHMRFYGKTVFLSICIGCQVVSGQVLLVPLFKILREIGLYNSRTGVVLLMCAFSVPMSLFLFHGFFKALPVEIYESAKMDGCRNLRYYFEFLLPLSKPIIASVTIFQALNAWNEYLFPLTFLRNPDLMPIPTVLKSLFSSYSQQYNANFAALTIVVAPILLLYVFLQKQFVNGLTSGAVKG